MKLYHTQKGILIESEGRFYLKAEDWDALINREALSLYVREWVKRATPFPDAEVLLATGLLPPQQSQEVWASGVTYYRSKLERQKESEKAGGGTFYEKVYQADRPELFFKAGPHRAVGSGQQVRIRKDSSWNVPEPELTLVINGRAQIVGYTIGNDMSSRSIEGENPLYLSQAKVYDGSAALGPCVRLADDTFDLEKRIALKVCRRGKTAFEESISISQMKRKPRELVDYLFRECSFPYGCLLMTGTGIIPPMDFTLQSGDEIQIRIDDIGTLINTVA